MGPRKHFLDWLRVFALALLILFHVGCLYATWGYNLKSPRISPSVEWIMLAVSPWRMALLFVISGVACRHLLAKLGAGGLALERARRLLPPLLVGMFVVIPPQCYVELVAKGVTHEGYLRFWIFDYLRSDPALVAALQRPMPTYDHLWFIAYLLVYALIFALAAGLGRAVMGRQREAFAREPARPVLPLGVLLVAPALCLIGADFTIERVAPVTFWIGDDWGSHLKWGGLFLTGVLLAGRSDYWAWTQRHRVSLAMVALLCFSLQSANRAFWLTGLVTPIWSALGWSAASGLFAWSMIGALVGYAGRYLDRPSPQLAHLNEAILPVYVLHQPILLAAAYLLFPLRLSLALEASAIAAATFAGAFLTYEAAIRPFNPMRLLFGVKTRRRPEKTPSPVSGALIEEPPTA
jgi:hypothetical protein